MPLESYTWYIRMKLTHETKKTIGSLFQKGSKEIETFECIITIESSVSLKDKFIVFYDGECGFCNHWVQWILERDKRISFRFFSSI